MGSVESVGKSCVGTVRTVGTVGMTLMSGICRLSGTVGFMSGYVENCRARAQLNCSSTCSSLVTHEANPNDYPPAATAPSNGLLLQPFVGWAFSVQTRELEDFFCPRFVSLCGCPKPTVFVASIYF